MLYFLCSNVVVNRSHLDLPFLLRYQRSQIYCQRRQIKVSHSFHRQKQAEILTCHLWSSHHQSTQMSESRPLQTRCMKVGFVLLFALFDFWFLVLNEMFSQNVQHMWCYNFSAGDLQQYAALTDMKRIKVSPPKPGCLYPCLSDIEATTETESLMPDDRWNLISIAMI
jgi:hypothetical protein